MVRASRSRRGPDGVGRLPAPAPAGLEVAAEPLGAPLEGGVTGTAARYRVREGHVLEVDDATSARMGLVRQKGTRPELLVRSALSALGHRFRLANRDLPGSPDIANRSRRWAVFVHGCFWHRHGCKASTTPGRNREFWEAKFARNVARDRRSTEALSALGYTVVVIWECDTKRGFEVVCERLRSALEPAVSNR